LKFNGFYIIKICGIIRIQNLKTSSPGVHADFDRDGKLMGIEVIEASKVMGKKIEIKLPELSAA